MTERRLHEYIPEVPAGYEPLDFFGVVVTTSFEEKTARGNWALRGNLFEFFAMKSLEQGKELAQKRIEKEELRHSDASKYRNFRSSAEFAQAYFKTGDQLDVVFVEAD